MSHLPRHLSCGCCVGGCMCAEHSPSRMAIECKFHAGLEDPPRRRRWSLECAITRDGCALYLGRDEAIQKPYRSLMLVWWPLAIGTVYGRAKGPVSVCVLQLLPFPWLHRRSA